METIFDKLCNLFENGISNDDDRELLANSLFYYCCGADPSPIMAFGSDYHLYVYADIVDYGHGDFNNETKILYQRLHNFGKILVKSRKIQGDGTLKKVKNAVLTLWDNRHHMYSLFPKDSDFFCLLYIQCDASLAFEKIYSDRDKYGHFNYIQPKCICNIQYEYIGGDWTILRNALKRTEYVMGHCHSDKYRRVAEYDYYGMGSSSRSKIPLFHRKYWYCF